LHADPPDFNPTWTLQEAKYDVNDANKAFFGEENSKMEAFNQRTSARKQAATALSDVDALGRERDTWKYKYRQSVAAMEAADKRAAAATASQTQLRAALEQAVHNVELLKTEKRRAEQEGQHLHAENGELGGMIEEEHEKVRYVIYIVDAFQRHPFAPPIT